MDNAYKRIKRITSHAGHARYLATLEDTGRYIPRVKEIPSPYAYSPTHTLYLTEAEQYVFLVETAHRQYDVFLVPEVPQQLICGNCSGVDIDRSVLLAPDVRCNTCQNQWRVR